MVRARVCVSRYTRADLEALICGVVDYEAEEPDGLGWQNLQAMCIF